MFRRVSVMFVSFMLIVAIWGSANPLVSAAQAQTAADYPTSFTGSLVERSSDRVAIRQTVYVAAYSAIRLGPRQRQGRPCNHIEYPQHLREKTVGRPAR